MATYYGGSGNDTNAGSILSDTLYGNAGNDSLNGGWGDDLVYGGTGEDTVLGDLGYDRLYGEAGNDLIYGGDDWYDDLYGGDGNDTIYAGNSHSDYSYGGAGDDLIYDGDGNDLARGGQGNDTIYGGQGSDTDAGGTGNDQVYGGQGADSLAGDDGNDTVDGGTEADTVQGGQGNDVLYGGDGADLIRGDIRTFSPGSYASGTGGTTTSFSITNTSTLTVNLYWIDSSGVGHLQGTLAPGQSFSTSTTTTETNWYLTDAATGDYLSIYLGGTNQSITFSNAFDDTIQGGQGADTIYGDYGNDSVNAGTENDVIYGGSGNDTVTGGSGDDLIDLGTGDDAVNDWVDNFANDTIYGGAGNDLLFGGNDNDQVYGGAGNDTLSGGTGSDTIYGGSGNDAASITDDHQSDIYDLGEEAGDSDALWFGNFLSSAGVSVTFSGADAGTYSYSGGASGTFSGVEWISGTNYGDTINAAADSDGVTVYGNAGADSITGGSGADLLDGGSGNDVLDSGAGNDTLVGGAGADTMYGGTGLDVVDYSASGAAVSVNLASGVMSGGDAQGDAGWGLDGIIGSAHDDTLTGADGESTVPGDLFTTWISAGAGNDLVYGGGGSDSLFGDAGNDTLYGGTGNDSLSGGADADRFLIAAGDGTDTIDGGETGSDLDTLQFSGSGVGVTLSGNEAGSYTLAGGGSGGFQGIEVITGTAGNDTINASAASGAGTFQGGGGDDSLLGGSGNEVLDGGSGNDTLYGGAGNDSLAGGAGDDLILGGDGNDTLQGDDGNDLLRGGAGNDTLAGGAGNDTFDFNRSSGTDRISDFDLTLVDGHTTDLLDMADLQNPDGSPLQWGDFTIANDGLGNTLLTFPEGETVLLLGVAPGGIGKFEAHQMGLPCFTAGTLIDTPGGRRPVETLRAGDPVVTPQGAATVLWAGGRRVGPQDLAARPMLRPVMIRRGALGNDRPLCLSRQHAVLLAGAGGQPVLARAGQLARLGQGAFRLQEGRREVSYHHVLLPRHSLVRANGAWVETLWPGPAGLAALGGAAAREIARALPWFGPALTAPGLLPLLYGPRVAPMLTGRALRTLAVLAAPDMPATESAPAVARDAELPTDWRQLNKIPAYRPGPVWISRITP
jgi:Ca2+-binding RTX toxin-like protein